ATNAPAPTAAAATPPAVGHAAPAAPAPGVTGPAPAALRAGLARTRGGFMARLSDLLGGKKELDAATFERLEEVLLTADIGVTTSQRLFAGVKRDLSHAALTDEDALWSSIRAQSVAILEVGAPPLDLDRARPLVILTIGVNGAGKTTTIGKLAARYVGAGKRVLLAAGDTFRAAATEQLEIWGERTGCPVVKGKAGCDPSSVIFEAVQRGAAEGYDIVLADTAGRLHTKADLMDELRKVRRVVGKALAGAPHETFLVLDSTNGQNAIAQARIFQEALAVSGIVLTKLDGTAKGGVILSICDELKLPVRYIGVGEKVDDLREFDATDFVSALYDRGAESASA
ncbi:MAG: signal recognition particle-docking protein FtsY, partial [Myxococcales bacterium]|nr:signal recognition particle-docking protein FtsY [Myxococcales bacterium]